MVVYVKFVQDWVLAAARTPAVRRIEEAVPWNGNETAYTDEGLLGVPQVSGVYAIWTANAWIYVGESGDVGRRLLEHATGQSEQSQCINRQDPTGCGYEVVAANRRVARQNELIAELRPVCNR